MPRAAAGVGIPQRHRPRRREVVFDHLVERRVVAPQQVAHAVGQPHPLALEFVVGPRPLAQFDDHRGGRLHAPQALWVGAQRRGQHARVAAVVLGARRRVPVAEPVELLRVDRVHARPCASKLSTTGPRGVSIATPTVSDGAAATVSAIHAAIAASPGPLCANTFSPRTAPAPSSTHTWWFCPPQSTPTYQFNSDIMPPRRCFPRCCRHVLTCPCTGARGADCSLGVHRGRKPPGHESYVGARGTGDGWSLPAALPSFAAVPRNV